MDTESPLIKICTNSPLIKIVTKYLQFNMKARRNGTSSYKTHNVTHQMGIYGVYHGVYQLLVYVLYSIILLSILCVVLHGIPRFLKWK